MVTATLQTIWDCRWSRPGYRLMGVKDHLQPEELWVCVRTGERRGYRSGYLPTQRREIEKGLREGTVKTVVATNALELGIDIGHVDVVCHIGAPRALSVLLQRVGRSGHWLGAVPKGILKAPSGAHEGCDSVEILGSDDRLEVLNGETDGIFQVTERRSLGNVDAV